MKATLYPEFTHKKSLRDAASHVLIEIGRADERVVVLDADLALSTKTIRFGQMFPERFFDMGISEQNMMGVAAGWPPAARRPSRPPLRPLRPANATTSSDKASPTLTTT
jgi:deoxyxylulose-5-phosphate synthase